MSDVDTVHIAGSRTAEDWITVRKQLIEEPNVSLWQDVAACYFHERLFRRYMDPIACLQKHGTFQGEGFSIVAIHCTLIEFLESTIRGFNYRCIRPGEALRKYEYSTSREMFVEFLTRRPPFSRAFDAPAARSFYENVRCGLLHEARTKNGWKIWAQSSDGSMVDPIKKVVYRNDFQAALLAFIADYEARLPQDTSLQEAFIRKFDGLAEN